MTSTSFNVGINETKNSSRVLKPPGGGHSDIFGIKDGSGFATPTKRKMGPPTTITSCFAHEEFDAKSKEKDEIDNNGLNTENGHGIPTPDENTEPAPEEIKDEEEKEKKIATPEGPRRARVPPGGYSSGLW